MKCCTANGTNAYESHNSIFLALSFSNLDVLLHCLPFLNAEDQRIPRLAARLLTTGTLQPSFRAHHLLRLQLLTTFAYTASAIIAANGNRT